MNPDPSSRAELAAELSRLRARLAAAEAQTAGRGHLALLEAVAAGNRPLGEVLDHLARLVEAERPGMACSILLYDADHHCLRHGAAPSLPEGYNAQVDGFPIGPAMGSCGTAAFRRERVVVEEIATDPLWAPFKEVAAAYDLCACWSQPILGSGGDLLGTLAMYYREPRQPTPEEIDLIETAAHVVALAIERHRNEQALRRLNRALLAYSGSNRALVRATGESAFLAEMCRVVVEEAGYRMAWVGLARDDAARTVEPVAQAGGEEGYLEQIEVTWGDDPRGRGPSGTAIRTGRPQVAQDILHDPAFAPWREAAVARGYGSSVALSFDGHHGHALGVLNVYAAEPHAFDDDEVALLAELAEDVSHGIRTLRGREERQRLEEERTGLERQLRQAQKMEAIGTLAGGIAHDFNNILQAIVGYADLGRAELADTAPARDYLDHILVGAKRARDLVNQILTFSHQTESRKRPCALQPVVKEALKLLAATLPSTIEVHAHVDPACPQVVSDPTQIHQVVMNLATNAFHAMRPAGGTLEVTLAPYPRNDAGEQPPEWLRLTVKDTGCGMDAATRERIFDPFFTTKPVDEGTGLGLAVVHGIVTDHGGRIEVETAPGGGTTIHVDLPLATEEGAEPPPPSPTPEGGGERIAVVDDDANVAAILGEILERLGYRPTLFTDPRHALEAIETAPTAPDLVITDQIMGAMSGTDLAATLADRHPDLPVILLTGYADAEVHDHPAIRRCLTKPIAAPDLARSLYQLLHPVPSR